MIVNRSILLSLLVMASLAGCCMAQVNENYGIVEAANDLGNLGTFVRAITQADMIDRLNDEGTLNLQNDTYIVFAPNDAAFRSLPSQAWNSIMANKDDLNTLLEYHIVENPNVDDIRNLRNIDTLKALDGRDVNLSYDNRALTVNGARVLESRMYSDGIVYVIDRVLLPDNNDFLDKYNLRDLRAETVTARANETTTVRRTNETNVTRRTNGAIVVSELEKDDNTDRTRVVSTANISERQNISAAERDFLAALEVENDLKTFTQALRAADLADLERDFYNRTNLAIFAPTDQAFSAIPENRWNDLLSNRDDLRKLLRYHIIDRSNLTDWNTTRGSVETLNGNELLIDRTNGKFAVNNATVLRTKYYNDSIIYVIDRVLFPNDRDFLDKYQLRDIAARYERRATTTTSGEDETGLPPQPRRTVTTRANETNRTDEQIYEERLQR